MLLLLLLFNFLKQLLWLDTRQQLTKLSTTELPLLSALVKPSSAVLGLGVNIDSQLTMAEHVVALRRSCQLYTDGEIFFANFGGRGQQPS